MNFRNIIMVMLTLGISMSAMAEPSKRLLGDQNKDGVLTKAEYVAWHEKHFNSIDANKDGNITAEEKKSFDEARLQAQEEKKTAKIEKKENTGGNKNFINRFFD